MTPYSPTGGYSLIVATTWFLLPMALTQGNMVLANGDALTLLDLYVYNGSANSNTLVLSVLSSGLFGERHASMRALCLLTSPMFVVLVGVASVLVLISVYVLQ